MDLLEKIEKLKNSVDKFEDLTEKLSKNVTYKQKEIDELKAQIQENIIKIDEIIKEYNADS